MKQPLIPRNIKNHLLQILILLAMLAAASLLAVVIRNIGFPVSSIVVVYVLSILLVARFTYGYFYGILASVIAFICYNFLFTEPYYTLNVYHKEDIISIAVMLTASVLTSTLTSKLIATSKLSTEREAQTNILYQITSSIAKASSVADVAALSVQCLSNLINDEVACIVNSDADKKIMLYSSRPGMQHIQSMEIDNDRVEQLTAKKRIVSIGDQNRQYGLLCLPLQDASEGHVPDGLISAVATQILIAMERENFSEEKKLAKIETEQEKFRSNLLRAISHDLRTPLTGISGTAELLLYNLEREEDRKLAEGIFEEANWLTQMVENILSLTKIAEGRLVLHKQKEAVEEIIAEAVKHARKVAGGRSITTEIPDDVLLVPMDGKLILQVLINLVDNAIKHTGQDGTIHIQVNQISGRVWFYVSDNGSGISQSDFPHLFEPFFIARNANRTSKSGAGLGLSIVKAIVQAHGGRIFAENNDKGGAVFKFYLPLEERIDDGI